MCVHVHVQINTYIIVVVPIFDCILLPYYVDTNGVVSYRRSYRRSYRPPSYVRTSIRHGVEVLLYGTYYYYGMVWYIVHIYTCPYILLLSEVRGILLILNSILILKILLQYIDNF